MTDLLSILCEAAGDFDELEDPRRAKKPKLGVSAKVGAQTRPASQSRHHSVSRAGQGHVMNTSPRQGVSDPKTRNGVSGPGSASASVQSPKARAMGVQLHSSSTYTRASPPTGLIFGFEERDGGNGPSSPNGSLDSSSVTSAMDEGGNGMEEVGSSSEDDEMTYGAHGQLMSEGNGSMLGGSGSGGNALLNSKKRKRVTKQSSRRAKPLTVEILYQIFEKLGIQKENVNGTYKLVLPTLKSAECSSVYFAVTEWQCFRKRIMNHGFEIVHEQQSSWIRVRPNLASPDGRLIFEDLELRRRYGTPCKIKNARERNEIFELPVLELELSSFDEEQPLRSSTSSESEDRLSQERDDACRALDAQQSFGANLGSAQPTLGQNLTQNSSQNLAQNFPTSKISGQSFGSGQQPSSPHDDSSLPSYEMYESAGDEQTDGASHSDFNRPAQTIGLSFGSKRSKRRGGRRMSDSAVVGGVAFSAQGNVMSSSVSSSSSSTISDEDEDAMMMGAAFDEEGEVDEDERSTHSMSWQSADEEGGSRMEQHGRYRRGSVEMREERGAAASVGRNGFGFGATPFSLASSPLSTSSGISVPLASSWAAAGYIGTPRTTLGTSITSTASPLSTSASNATSLASSLGNLPPTNLGSSPLGSSPLITSFFSSINLSGTPHFNLPSFSSVVNASPSPVLANSLSESESNAEDTRPFDRPSLRPSPTLDRPSEHADGHVAMDVDASPRSGEPTHQLEGALRHCFRLPLVARELLSNGHFSLSNGQFDIQVTMKHSPRALSPPKSTNISFGPSSPTNPSPLNTSLNTSPIPHFPPFSAVSGNTPQ